MPLLTRRIWIVIVSFFLIGLSDMPARAQTSAQIPREVIEHTSAHGKAAILIGMNLPWRMESQLSEEQIERQRLQIAAAQDELLKELAGRNFRIVRRYELGPSIALEVGADALSVLARSEWVLNVLLDDPIDAQRSQRVWDTSHLTNVKVPVQLYRRAATNGTVLVLAGLRAPWQKEDRLNVELLKLQREGILDAQRYLLKELNGTQYQVIRLYNKIPGIALRVGFDALRVLEKSPAITNVLPDRPAQNSHQ